MIVDDQHADGSHHDGETIAASGIATVTLAPFT